MRFSQALVTAVTDAGRAILAIFGYVLLFSAVFGLISPYLGASPWVRTMAGGLLEVTFGCAAASRLGGWVGLALAAFFIGFRPFIICQVSSLMLFTKQTGFSQNRALASSRRRAERGFFRIVCPLAGPISNIWRLAPQAQPPLAPCFFFFRTAYSDAAFIMGWP
jgi:hypothetical protein